MLLSLPPLVAVALQQGECCPDARPTHYSQESRSPKRQRRTSALGLTHVHIIERGERMDLHHRPVFMSQQNPVTFQSREAKAEM